MILHFPTLPLPARRRPRREGVYGGCVSTPHSATLREGLLLMRPYGAIFVLKGPIQDNHFILDAKLTY